MRWLSWILMIPLAATVIVFSISNRAVTTVDLWPFGYSIELPVFGIVLTNLLLGFVLGGIVAWLSNSKKRSQARVAKKDAVSARSELAAIRQGVTQESSDPQVKRLEQSRISNDAGAGTF